MKEVYTILAFIIIVAVLFISGCMVGQKMKENEVLKASQQANKEGNLINDKASQINDHDYHFSKPLY